MYGLYSMFDRDYILKQMQQQHDFEQKLQVQDSVKKLKDFLDSMDKIEPMYQNMASFEYSAVIIDYMKKHGMM